GILSFLGRRRNLGCRQGHFSGRQQGGRAEDFHSCSAREFHDRTPSWGTRTRVYTNWILFEPVTLKAKEIHSMLRAIMGIGLAVVTSCAALAQSPEGSPAFEVASVKPAAPPEIGRFRVGMNGGPGTADPGQITYSNVTLKNVLMNAYGVKGYQISGPSWLDSERYDIAAKIPK